MKTLILWTVMLAGPLRVQGGLLDFLGLGKSDTNQNAAAALPASLSQDQVASALKEALGKGVQQAVSSLGHDGGFLTNLNVRIPMPPKLQAAEKTLRFLGEEKLADEFVGTMNHAAERAVPQAAAVFSDAIRGMSIQDARAILTGGDNAATEYFRRTTQTNLFVKFLPIVKQATDQTGVTSAYKRFIEKGTQSKALGSFGQALLGAESVDLDSYITDKSLDGLFRMIAEEEKRIRQSAAARTSDLLQRVFGAVSRQ